MVGLRISLELLPATNPRIVERSLGARGHQSIGGYLLLVVLISPPYVELQLACGGHYITDPFLRIVRLFCILHVINGTPLYSSLRPYGEVVCTYRSGLYLPESRREAETPFVP